MSDLDRHVIKGRGENRGKYLCYSYQAGLPPGDYIWLPDQRKAARWKDPHYNRDTYQGRVAREHNGYFVKLVAPRSLDVASLRTFISRLSAGAIERLPCHWLDGDFDDAGLNYCRGCAEKFVDEKYAADPKAFEELYYECESAEERYRAAIDGGWRTEHDSPPYCETCGAPLDGSLTDYGASEEIDALTGACPPSFKDAEGWEELDNAIIDLADDHPAWRRIARVVETAARTGLLSVLGARRRELSVIGGA